MTNKNDTPERVTEAYAMLKKTGLLEKLSQTEGGKGNYMTFCILKTLEAMSGEKTEVKDITEGLIVRNYVSYDQRNAIDNVKRVLSPYWSYNVYC